MSDLQKMGEGIYIVPKEGNMKVPGLIIATEKLLQEIEIEKPLQQVKNVATLPGIVGYSIAMPDIHWGYGFPIGGVAAMEVDTGVISPGGVGYDINCGVRLAVIPEKFKSFSEEIKEKLLMSIFRTVPSGVGRGHKGVRGLSDRDYKELIEQGAHWSIEQGYGLPEDVEKIESRGKIEGASIDFISSHAKERGRDQLGTVGSGNHFIEIGEVGEIQQKEVATIWGIEEGQTYLLIHTGSRGFGHQVCQDTLNEFIKLGFAEGLVDKQLVAAPVQSEPGRKYLAAMSAAANFAFNNRQKILHFVRQSFLEVCGIQPQKVRLIYDVCHNIAKMEEYEVEGKLKKLCIHRKGATRAFGKGAKELVEIYQKTGQPVLVPGDMGRASYLLVGLGNELTWCSSCHGAGRAKSRIQSMKAWRGKDLVKYMEQQGVHVMSGSYKTIAEEMPDAYKDIDEVVQAVQLGGLANIVAKLIPSLVIKG